MAVERFAPTVLMQGPYGGYTVTPKGWMWILAFALAGVPWAIVRANEPEFREAIRADLLADRIADCEAVIADFIKQIAAIDVRKADLQRDLERRSAIVAEVQRTDPNRSASAGEAENREER